MILSSKTNIMLYAHLAELVILLIWLSFISIEKAPKIVGIVYFSNSWTDLIIIL